MLILELADAGSRVVSRKVKNGIEHPVIDINSPEVLSVLSGFETVRVVVQSNRIVILPLATDVAKKERISRLRNKLEAGDPLKVGSVSHGGGVLTHALHQGMKDVGLDTKLAFANDIRDDLLEQASGHNEAWDDETITLAAPMQELAFDTWATNHLPKVEVLEGGIPCSGASVAGRAKRGLAQPEDHPEVGHLVVSFLALIAKVQPAVVLLENVVPYASSASMSLIRNQLRDFGYVVHEETLKAAEWNALEHRERLCMVAVTEGIDFDFSQLKRPEHRTRKVAEILDPIPSDHESWSRMEGLKAKEIRDKEAGKGFAMQIVTGFDTKCPTVTKGYSKVRSTDPKLQHPENPDLLRQFTPAEHARIKGIPERLVEGMANTTAHELLGQSICHAPFVSVGQLIGKTLQAASTLGVTTEDVFELKVAG